MYEENIKEKTLSFINKMLKDGVNTAKDVESIFMRCLDQLRSIGITEYSAFKNIVPFLVLRMIEPLIDQNIVDVESDDQYENDETLKPYFDQYKKYLKFSNLYAISKDHKNVKGYDIVKIVKIILTILSNHKSFIGIITSHSVQIEDEKRMENMINLIHTLPAERQDLIGEGYELFLKRFGEGKNDFSQFFTPQFVRNFIVETMDLEYGKSILDPAAGSGGFLLSALDYLDQKYENIDKMYTATYFYGKEIQQDTLLNCKTNILLKSGLFSQNFIREDTLKNFDEYTYDYVISNPPFGLKGNNWKDTVSYRFRNEEESREKWFIPIKTNESTSMFMQAIVSYTAVGGKCAIVLPYGKEMTSTNGALFNIRKAIFTACKITHFVELPKGTFSNASGISTCILFLEKVYDFSEIMKIKNTGSKQTIKFIKDVINSEINMMTIDQDLNLNDLGIKKLNKFPDYVLTFYQDEVVMDSDYDFYRLIDICDIKAGKSLTSDKFIKDGIYPVIGGGTKPAGFYNEFNTEENTILISRMGNAGFISKYRVEVFCTEVCFRILNIDEKWDHDFLYCYLKYYVQDFIFSLRKGTCQKGINLKDLQQVLIPLYPMKMQIDISQKVLKIEEIIDFHSKIIEGQIYSCKYIVEKIKERYKYRMEILNNLFEMKNGKSLSKKKYY